MWLFSNRMKSPLGFCTVSKLWFLSWWLIKELFACKFLYWSTLEHAFRTWAFCMKEVFFANQIGVWPGRSGLTVPLRLKVWGCTTILMLEGSYLSILRWYLRFGSQGFTAETSLIVGRKVFFEPDFLIASFKRFDHEIISDLNSTFSFSQVIYAS